MPDGLYQFSLRCHLHIMRLSCACGAEYEVTAKPHPSNERERRLCVGCERPLDRIASTRVFEFKFVSPWADEAQAKKAS